MRYLGFPILLNKDWKKAEETIEKKKLVAGKEIFSQLEGGETGRLGILDLEIMNIALLGKWLWNLENSEGLWQQMYQTKVFIQKHFGCCKNKIWGLPFLSRGDGEFGGKTKKVAMGSTTAKTSGK
uniref:Uncharacterized protein n=1 Tax=Oryza meridionalis TaxID=40149 RepID=A0A0E0ES12_9ORYZ